MTINNIGVYNRLLNTLKEKTSGTSSATTGKTEGTEASGNISGKNTGTSVSGVNGMSYIDTLELGNVDEDNYLNYGQMAKYNMPTLSDFLSDGEDGNDSEGMDFSSILGDGGSSSDSSTMFDGLIQSTTKENNQAIQKAIEKMQKSDSAKDPDFLKKLEEIKAEIKSGKK